VKLISAVFLNTLFEFLYRAQTSYSLLGVLNAAMHDSYSLLLPFIDGIKATETHLSPVGSLIYCADQLAVVTSAGELLTCRKWPAGERGLTSALSRSVRDCT